MPRGRDAVVRRDAKGNLRLLVDGQPLAAVCGVEAGGSYGEPATVRVTLIARFVRFETDDRGSA